MSEQDYRLDTIIGMYETLSKCMNDVHKLCRINQELRDELESLKQLAEYYKKEATEARNQLIVQGQMAMSPSY